MHREYVCRQNENQAATGSHHKIRPQLFQKKWTKIIFLLLRNERFVVKSRLSCLPTAEKVGITSLLNDAVNGEIVDASLAREKYSVIIPGKNGGLSHSKDANR